MTDYIEEYLRVHTRVAGLEAAAHEHQKAYEDGCQDLAKAFQMLARRESCRECVAAPGIKCRNGGTYLDTVHQDRYTKAFEKLRTLGLPV